MSRPNRAEQLIYKAFKKALEQNLLYIYLDTDKMNRPNSPIYNPWENLLPLLLPVIIGLALILSKSVFYGLAFIIGTIILYKFGIRHLISKILLKRAKKYLTQDFRHCEKLWKFGGLVLAAAANRKVSCIAPDGSWKDYIVENFSYLMTEEQEEKKDTKNEKSAA